MKLVGNQITPETFEDCIAVVAYVQTRWQHDRGLPEFAAIEQLEDEWYTVHPDSEYLADVPTVEVAMGMALILALRERRAVA